MGSLTDILYEVISGYTVKGLNGYSVLTMDADQSLFTSVSTTIVKGSRTINTSLIACLENNQIFIDHDINSKPRVDAWVQAGISRTRINHLNLCR